MLEGIVSLMTLPATFTAPKGNSYNTQKHVHLENPVYFVDYYKKKKSCDIKFVKDAFMMK